MSETVNEEDNEKDKRPIFISPWVISIILGVIFGVFTCFWVLIINMNKTPSVNYNVFLKHNCIVFLAILAVMFAFIYGIMYVLIIGGTNHKKALPFIGGFLVVTLGFTFIITSIPGNVEGSPFIKIFENSVGYAIISYWNKNVLNKMFEFKDVLKPYPFDARVILTTFNTNNFDKLYKDLCVFNPSNNVIDPNIVNYQFIELKEPTNTDTDPIDLNKENNLMKMVLQKNAIGVLCWYYMTSFMTTIASLKYLILL
jgi:hypothetical protein